MCVCLFFFLGDFVVVDIYSSLIIQPATSNDLRAMRKLFMACLYSDTHYSPCVFTMFAIHCQCLCYCKAYSFRVSFDCRLSLQKHLQSSPEKEQEEEVEKQQNNNGQMRGFISHSRRIIKFFHFENFHL